MDVFVHKKLHGQLSGFPPAYRITKRLPALILCRVNGFYPESGNAPFLVLFAATIKPMLKKAGYLTL